MQNNGIKGNFLHKLNKAVRGIYLPMNFSQLDECCTVFMYLWVKLWSAYVPSPGSSLPSEEPDGQKGLGKL